MKTLEIKDLLKKDLLVVELPDTYDLDWVTDEKHMKAVIDAHNHVEQLLGNPVHSYTLLGKPDEISEEDARELVDKVTYSYSDGSGEQTSFKHYNSNLKKGTLVVETATESLLSALETVIFWENPNPLGDFVYSLEEWEADERKTFEKSRTLIFVKR